LSISWLAYKTYITVESTSIEELPDRDGLFELDLLGTEVVDGGIIRSSSMVAYFWQE
jgi:hypothetical protein